MKKTRRHHTKQAVRRKGRPPAAPESTNSAVRKHPISKEGLELLEALGFL